MGSKSEAFIAVLLALAILIIIGLLVTNEVANCKAKTCKTGQPTVVYHQCLCAELPVEKP